MKRLNKAFLSCLIIALLCLTLLSACQRYEFVFSTDIVDNAVVTDKMYEFRSTATYGGEVCRMEITCNGILLDGENGKYKASLVDGDNTIEVTAISGNAREERKYTVTYRAEFDISTSLENAVIKNDCVVFSANATFNDLPCAVVVTHNGNQLTAENGLYTATLCVGENKFIITARYGDYAEQKDWTIVYGEFVLTSDIKEFDSANEDYSFRAAASYNGSVCNLSVTVNNVAVKAVGNRYDVTLQKGDNAIVITAEYDGIIKEYCYTVRYFDDPPTLSTSIENNNTYRGSIFNFDVTARDGLGAKLPKEGVTFAVDWNADDGVERFVSVDGISLVWDDNTMTSYRIRFNSGEFASHANKAFILKVSASDSLGRQAFEEYTMTYVPTEYGEEIGEVAFALEGFSISCGYFIEPMWVPIYEGIPFSVTLTDILRERGYEYTYTGELQSGFYLASVIGLDLTGNSIADGIWERVSGSYNRTLAIGSSLGEFDYGSGSGWMYSVNGVYKNYGFADYYPQDKDVVRVQFTVMLGEDLGGGGALGSGSASGWLDDNPDYAPIMKLLADIQRSETADKSVYEQVVSVITQWNLSQSVMNEQMAILKTAYGV